MAAGAGAGLDAAPAGATGAGPSEYAFVTNATSNTVTVLDTSATPPTVVSTVQVGYTPHGIAVTPNGAEAFVTNYNDGTVSVINSGSNTVTRTINVGTNPTGIAISGSDAFVVNAGSNSVSVINTATDTVAATVSVGTNPTSVAISDGHAWVTNYGGGTVTPINTTSPFTAGTPITVPNPSAIAADPVANVVYVTESESAKVAVINTATQTLETPVDVGNGPDGVVVTPTGTRVLVSNFSDGTVTEFTATTPTTQLTTSLGAGSYPLGITTNAAGTSAYVVLSGPNSVAQLTISSLKDDGTVGVGTGALAVADSPAATLTVPAQSLPAATIGQVYDYQLQANGGAGGYQWAQTSGTLPAGLSLAGNGLISGTVGTAATTEGNLTFQVTDASTATASNSPTFGITVNVVTVNAQTLPGGILGTAYAGATITAVGGTGGYKFTVTGGHTPLPAGLTINATTGAIGGSVSSTPAVVGTHTFTIVATDTGSHAGSQSFSITIAASAPVVTTSSLPTALVGSNYPLTTLTASGGTAPYTWTVSSGQLPDGLTLTSAGALSGPVSSAGTFATTFEVTDANGNTATKSLTIITAGTLAITTTSLPGGVQGTAYSQTIGTTGGDAPLTFAVASGALPAGLHLNATTGAITGTPTTVGPGTFTVKVTDSFTPTAQSVTSGSLSINITAPLAITTTSLPGGVVGTAYDQSVVATGGITPLTYSISLGSLPNPLTINPATGAISGTPTTPGTSDFIVTVTDSTAPKPVVVSSVLSITVSAALTVATKSLPDGAVGSSYSQTIGIANGTSPFTYTVYSGSLPTGLHLSASTGAISGTPTTAGTATFTVKVTDSSSPVQSATSTSLSITVEPQLKITTSNLASGAVGSPYAQSVTTSGGVSPLTFSIQKGSLPAGLHLNTTSGTITGTPTTAEISSFVVEVTDSSAPTAQTASQLLSITVNPALAVTTPSLPGGKVGSDYNQTVKTANGTAPFTFSIKSGALPAGLHLDATTGAITGTPTTAGISTFTVEVTDSSSPVQTAMSGTLSIEIAAASTQLRIKTTALPGGVMGSAYSQSVATTGGVQPIKFAIGLGTLPAGLHLDATTGAITGTPTATGTSTFTVTAADSSTPTPETAQTLLSITVYPALAVTTASLPGGTVGGAYSQTIGTANGKAPFTFSVASGSLPAGLSLNSGTGAITGTPTSAGVSTFTIKVTDSSSPVQSATSGSLSITIVAQTGYDLVGSDGGVFVFPTGQSGGFYGSLPGLGVTVHDIVGMVPSNDYKGYFLVGADGGVFAFGDATFEGSLPGLGVTVHDIVGIVPSSDDKGYFLVGSDGGVFAFGDSTFEGSLPGDGVSTQNVVGIAATPDNRGYWVVLSTGSVYNFGTAGKFGSASTSSPISGIAGTPDGGGYWLVAQNGAVYAFGDAQNFGSLPASGISPPKPVVGIVPTIDQKGYWIIGADGSVYPYGDAKTNGDLPKLGVAVTDVVGAVPTIL
jgi:YVTN family beta-propeller protein